MKISRASLTKASRPVAVLILVLAFQNCSQTSFLSSDGSSQLTVPLPVGFKCSPNDAPGLAPKLKYSWTLAIDPSVPDTQYNQVMAAPMVGDLDGDGVPEIVFVAFSGTTANYGNPGALRVIDGRDGTLKGSFSTPGLAPIGYTSPLLIDLAGDGHKEIVYYTGSKAVALNSDLSVRWALALPAAINSSYGCMGGFAAADLDGDGRAEIIADRFVLEENAAQEPSVRFTMGAGAGCTTFAASLDPAKPGQLQVVGGDGVYDARGNKLFSYQVASDGTDFSEGYLAAGDVDSSHPGVEIAISKNGATGLFDGVTGQLIWKSIVTMDRVCDVPGYGGGGIGRGGPPNIGDFKGNGELEIGVATGKYYSVYDKSGKLMWDFPSRDCSSAITGATLFDFNGDGKPEIIYSDENFLRIFDAASGTVLYQIPNPSATLMEYPVVADVNGDGHSELVVVTNNIFENLNGFFEGVSAADQAAIRAVPPGIRVFEAATPALWVPTRTVWNQYSYFVNNVTDQMRATASTPTSAADGASFFRQNVLNQFKNLCQPLTSTQ